MAFPFNVYVSVFNVSISVYSASNLLVLFNDSILRKGLRCTLPVVSVIVTPDWTFTHKCFPHHTDNETK